MLHGLREHFLQTPPFIVFRRRMDVTHSTSAHLLINIFTITIPIGFMNQETLHIQARLTAWLNRRTTTGGVRRVALLGAAIASELGCVRQDNQDRALVARGRDKSGQEYAVVAVADGMGGMRDGAACASLTVGAFVASLNGYDQARDTDIESRIRQAIIAADRAVFEKFGGDGGSTLVALVIRPGHSIHWASVGDSRVYTSSGKTLTQVSVDDTIAGQLGKNVEGGFDQSKLLQFVGMGSEIEPHVVELLEGNVDAIILTTDGIHYLGQSPNWLGQIIVNAPDPGACVKRLVELAKWCGGPDNATVAMISLSANWESNDQPDYSCLEVWDSFGELQILSENLALGNAYKNGVKEIREMPARRDSNEIFKVESLKQPSKNAAIEVERGNKVSRKKPSATRKRNKPSLELADEEAPQLSMKFPAKTTS